MLRRLLPVFLLCLSLGCSVGGAISAPAQSPEPSSQRSSSPASSPAPSVVPSPSGSARLGAPTPVDAAVALLPGFTGTACRPSAGGPMWSRANECPITLRLEQRLQTARAYADPVCRCQNWTQVSGRLVGQDRFSAQVRVTVQFQPSYDLDFTVTRQGDGWLVDDITCGNPPASVYQEPLGPCR